MGSRKKATKPPAKRGGKKAAPPSKSSPKPRSAARAKQAAPVAKTRRAPTKTKKRAQPRASRPRQEIAAAEADKQPSALARLRSGVGKLIARMTGRDEPAAPAGAVRSEQPTLDIVTSDILAQRDIDDLDAPMSPRALGSRSQRRDRVAAASRSRKQTPPPPPRSASKDETTEG